MVLYFNKKDLTKFGNYLLSDERTQLIKEGSTKEDFKENLKNVHHSDFENWKAKQ